MGDERRDNDRKHLPTPYSANHGNRIDCSAEVASGAQGRLHVRRVRRRIADQV